MLMTVALRSPKRLLKLEALVIQFSLLQVVGKTGIITLTHFLQKAHIKFNISRGFFFNI